MDSPEEALSHLRAESGVSYDPRVVACIERRHQKLEEVVERTKREGNHGEVMSYARKEVGPSAGYAEMPNEAEVRAASFLASIVSARQEAQLLSNWPRRSAIHSVCGKRFRLLRYA